MKIVYSIGSIANSGGIEQTWDERKMSLCLVYSTGNAYFCRVYSIKQDE